MLYPNGNGPSGSGGSSSSSAGTEDTTSISRRSTGDSLLGGNRPILSAMVSGVTQVEATPLQEEVIEPVE